MKFFLDTEFSERGRDYPVKLISLGIVSENGDSYYAVSSEFTDEECNPWVQENVLPHLGKSERLPVAEIARRVAYFIGEILEP